MENKNQGTSSPDHQAHLVSEHRAVVSDSPIYTPTQTIIQPKRNWFMGIVVFITLLISIASLGAAAYLYLFNQQQRDLFQLELKQQQQFFTAKLNQQQSSFNNQLSKPLNRIINIEKQQTVINNDLAQLENLPDEQHRLKEQVNKLIKRDPHDWMIAEADYLVKMAGRKLWVENDPATALMLLKDADGRIAAIQNQSLMPIRHALTQDIATVSAIKTTNISQIVQQLNSVIKLIPQLPLNEPQRSENIEQQKSSNDNQGWKAKFSEKWHVWLNELVSIRRKTTDMTPLLPPQQEWYLVENIRNKLLQAQLALYRHELTNYQQSLIMAQDWLNQYFDLKSNKVKQVQSELKQFMEVKIVPIPIKSFASTPLLNQLSNYGELVTPNGEESTL